MTPSTATNLGYDAVAMTQEERWKTSQVMCHGQGGLNERPFDGTS